MEKTAAWRGWVEEPNWTQPLVVRVWAVSPCAVSTLCSARLGQGPVLKGWRSSFQLWSVKKQIHSQEGVGGEHEATTLTLGILIS